MLLKMSSHSSRSRSAFGTSVGRRHLSFFENWKVRRRIRLLASLVCFLLAGFGCRPASPVQGPERILQELRSRRLKVEKDVYSFPRLRQILRVGEEFRELEEDEIGAVIERLRKDRVVNQGIMCVMLQWCYENQVQEDMLVKVGTDYCEVIDMRICTHLKDIVYERGVEHLPTGWERVLERWTNPGGLHADAFAVDALQEITGQGFGYPSGGWCGLEGLFQAKVKAYKYLQQQKGKGTPSVEATHAPDQ